MQVKMGEFSNGFAWFIEHEGKMVDQGWAEDVKQARKDAKAAAFFHTTHDYETDEV